MDTVILVIHLLLALAMVALVLLQRSEGGALGIGGGGMGLVSGRAAGNILTKATGYIAGAFFLTSLALAILSGGDRGDTADVLGVGAEDITGPAIPGQAGGQMTTDDVLNALGAEPAPSLQADPDGGDATPSVPLSD